MEVNNDNFNEKNVNPETPVNVTSDVTEEIRARRSKLLKKRLRKNKKSNPDHTPIFTKRRVTYGSISVVLTVAFIAAIVLLNLGVSYLTDRFYLKADMTPTGIYEISDATKILLGNLDMDIRVHVLQSEDAVTNSTFYNVAKQFLERYRAESGGRISINYVDILKNPTFVNNYKDRDETIDADAFILESDLRYKILKLSDLYNIVTTLVNEQTYETAQYVSDVTADQTLASAVQYVTAEDLPTVVFTTGHDEQYGPQFTDLFTNSNYGYDEVNTLFDEIPGDTAILVVGMPSADYTDLEVNKLDAYVKNGGNVMLFTGVTNVPTPNLNEWLEEYGIGVTDMRVLDNERALYSPANIVAGISDKTITGEMVVSDTTYILMPEARALEQLFTRENNRETTVFLMSSDASYAKVITPDATTQTNTFEEGDKTGPFPVGIMSNYGVTVSGVTTSGRVVVFSSLLMSADSVFDISSLANKAFFSEAINYINPITNVLSIEAREYYSEDLTILSAQGDVVFWVLLIIIPSAILLLGIGVWVKRRHK